MARQLAVRQKYMSWNAASAAQAEIIEYLEELVDLSKLLVGANEFRSGLLTRPIHPLYKVQSEFELEKPIGAMDGATAMHFEARDVCRGMPSNTTGSILRRRTTAQNISEDGEDIPTSLRRIQSRKLEAGSRR